MLQEVLDRGIELAGVDEFAQALRAGIDATNRDEFNDALKAAEALFGDRVPTAVDHPAPGPGPGSGSGSDPEKNSLSRSGAPEGASPEDTSFERLCGTTYEGQPFDAHCLARFAHVDGARVIERIADGHAAWEAGRVSWSWAELPRKIALQLDDRFGQAKRPNPAPAGVPSVEAAAVKPPQAKKGTVAQHSRLMQEHWNDGVREGLMGFDEWCDAGCPPSLVRPGAASPATARSGAVEGVRLVVAGGPRATAVEGVLATAVAASADAGDDPGLDQVRTAVGGAVDHGPDQGKDPVATAVAAAGAPLRGGVRAPAAALGGAR